MFREATKYNKDKNIFHKGYVKMSFRGLITYFPSSSRAKKKMLTNYWEDSFLDSIIAYEDYGNNELKGLCQTLKESSSLQLYFDPNKLSHYVNFSPEGEIFEAYYEYNSQYPYEHDISQFFVNGMKIGMVHQLNEKNTKHKCRYYHPNGRQGYYGNYSKGKRIGAVALFCS
ncbi:MAG: hypothetical protein JKY48_03680 [Flavobacteriales bacterium]|nr:hypothetical protein [Flavobacteriales bacterium]